MDKPSKWKAPEWMKPGAKARVFKGKGLPVGTVGTIVEVYSTGNGAKALLDTGTTPPGGTFPSVWILNLEPV